MRDHGEGRQETVLGIIAARGGSKGLPGKNILPLAGKPLIAYTIEAAATSTLLDRTIVSTDNRQIAEVARQWGAEVPFMRPAELAADDTLSFPVLLHGLDWLARHDGYVPSHVMLLQPTSPLRTAEDIDAAIRVARERGADSVVSCTPVGHRHPYWMKKLTDDGRMVDFMPVERFPYRRQELPPAYALNGAIYLAKGRRLLEMGTWFSDRSYPYLMPEERSLDIDSPLDLRVAELLLAEGATVQ